MPPSYNSSKIIPACYFHFLSTKDAKKKRNTRSSRVKRVYKLIRGSYLFYRASKKRKKKKINALQALLIKSLFYFASALEARIKSRTA